MGSGSLALDGGAHAPTQTSLAASRLNARIFLWYLSQHCAIVTSVLGEILNPNRKEVVMPDHTRIAVSHPSSSGVRLSETD